jgi:hypothetical protein
MRSNNLFANTSVLSEKYDKIKLTAHRLSVEFSQEKDLPIRFRKKAGISRQTKKINDNSNVEKNFRSLVTDWTLLIETMLAKIDQKQAWRFIDCNPQIDNKIEKVTDNKDFCDFNEYIILRRDQENCGPEELGGLVVLFNVFQKKVQKHILARSTEESSKNIPSNK